MKMRKWFPFLLAVVLILGSSIGTAVAYFTTYAETKGGYVIRLGGETEIEEEFSDWTKHVVITSRENSSPVFVRVKAVSGKHYPLEISGSGWSLGAGDYWYYNDVLPGGSQTSQLDIAIKDVPASEAREGDEIDVAVVYECVLAIYKADGSPDPDTAWNQGEVTVIQGGNS
ncbi:MAG: hypothetical protein IJ179_08190 [Oscillospiraceae bacterium]|nr:hypothetical protein [Oscillospiraceae bacterium]